LLAKLQASECKSRVKNIGPVSSANLPEVYRNADALIHPTLLESYSRTYLEAMHFGLPILTSDRDFARHLCGEAALYFDPLDAASVARAMADIMEDQYLYCRLVEKGRRIVQRAPRWNEITARFVEILERAARHELPDARKADVQLLNTYAHSR
jgi:glycosyltransferase involved in cell wall biosynthesis